MNTKRTCAVLVIVFAITGFTLFSLNCYNDDETRVTIHIQRNDLAALGIQPEPEPGIIDRILNFFSTPAEAGATWSNMRTDIVLTVTSDSFGEKTFTLPANATSFTTTLPSGSDTVFTIRSWYLDSATSRDQVYWGGQINVVLGPGEQEISIQMKPMSWIWSASPSTGSVYLSWVTGGYTITINSYNIYRSSSINGTYDKIASNVTSYTDTGVVAGTTYYYKVSTNSSLGESILSEPSTPVTAY